MVPGGIDLSAFLSSLGVSAPEVSHAAADAAKSFCADTGVPVEVFSVRFGVMTLSCSQQGASRLLAVMPELSRLVSDASSGSLTVRLRPSASFGGSL